MFLEKEGLSVEYISSGGSMDSISRVASGAVDFAIADTSEVARMSSKEDLSIRMLNVIVKEPSISVRFIKGRGIVVQKILKGKGTPTESQSQDGN